MGVAAPTMVAAASERETRKVRMSSESASALEAGSEIDWLGAAERERGNRSQQSEPHNGRSVPQVALPLRFLVQPGTSGGVRCAVVSTQPFDRECYSHWNSAVNGSSRLSLNYRVFNWIQGAPGPGSCEDKKVVEKTGKAQDWRPG